MEYKTYEKVTEFIRQNYWLIFPGILYVGAIAKKLIDKKRDRNIGKCVDKIFAGK